MDVPKFIHNMIDKYLYSCPKCQSTFRDNGIYGFGIKCSHLNESRHALFIDYKCQVCQMRTLMEVAEMDLTDLAIFLQEELQDSVSEAYRQSSRGREMNEDKSNEKPSRKKAKKKSKSRITKEEQKDALDDLDKINNLDDWNKLFGLVDRGDRHDFYISDREQEKDE